MMPTDFKKVPLRLLQSGPKNSTVFILGTTGSGKSTLLAHLLAQRKRWVLVDSKDDFAAEWFGKDVATANSASEFVTQLNAGRAKIIVAIGMTNAAEEVNELCRVLLEFQRLNPQLPPITLCLDELNQFCETGECGDYLADVIQRGRSLKIEKIFGAQWFGTIPTWIRDSFTELYIFRHTDPAGVGRLAEFGFDPEEIMNLPRFAAIHGGPAVTTTERVLFVPSANSGNKTN
jgi:hypothetical protein